MSQNMLTSELAPLFWNLTTMPQRDDQRLCQVPRARLRAIPRLVGPSAVQLVFQELTTVGFNTTFGFLARGTFSFSEMSWILIKVFFGSSYLGFVCAVSLHRGYLRLLTIFACRMLLNR
jgi:hypothetical protein